MLNLRKPDKGEVFEMKHSSLLLTTGDIRNGDFTQDFAIVSKAKKPDLEALGIALGVQAIRHPEVVFILTMALRVAQDPDTWESEGKEMPQGDINEWFGG
jgi:hypothetical protein